MRLLALARVLTVAGAVALANEVVADTYNFQNGVSPTSGYAGSTDTEINGQNPSSNYGGNGTVQVQGNMGGLMRWDVSAIPAGSTVQSATITLQITRASSQLFPVYEAK